MTVLCQWSRHEGGAHTGDDAANNKLVPGQVLSTIIRHSKGVQRGKHGAYPWHGRNLDYCPNRNKRGSYNTSQHYWKQGFQSKRTDVHVPSPSNLIPIEQGEQCSEQASDFINCSIERLHG